MVIVRVVKNFFVRRANHFGLLVSPGTWLRDGDQILGRLTAAGR
jgi:hypothetical protein